MVCVLVSVSRGLGSCALAREIVCVLGQDTLLSHCLFPLGV